MKKYIIFSLVILYVLASYLFKRDLVIKNIEYYILTGHSQVNIERAIFYFDDENEISKVEVKNKFLYSDSIVILSKDEFEKRFENNMSDYKRPIFSADIDQYFIFARAKNTTLAGGESLVSIADYIWLPWGWINIDNYVEGGA